MSRSPRHRRTPSQSSKEPPATARSAQPGETRQGVRKVVVDEDNAGQRVDNYLMAQVRDLPRSIIYRIIRKGEVRVNKGRVKPDTRLKAGDEVRIPPVTRREKPAQVVPGARVQNVMEGAIIFENDQMLVVNKPSGIAVHGGSGVDFGLIEVLRAARPQSKFLELVHRLDRDTSGLIMVAKKRSALRYLQDELRQKRIRKHYHALVSGQWDPAVARVSEPLLRFELKSGERRVRVDAAGKESLTLFRCLKQFSGYTLVQASPVTGRTHQIRVHSAWAGHPIAGDDKYMDDVSLKAFRSAGGERLMLHARALEFTLPSTGEPIRLEAPYDDAFGSIVSKFGARLETGE
ncbi:23S rRNA pseudouridine(955/2504/2580) synthase RluC [Marinobacter confluentis]|uniref:Pseudouridine synthase n=1 Tax=Marinobacter confluentis TaxID=1697557 RepID=A0A4Z1BTC9_9GAMM|nr:23S rRNA pseudouridine(955/2504/2580) synthase RluC [Marinobacter confluentis]TGN41315.1 23S rRNA pseudouridine(955/2504/2580) synthase RluC [Marinobacter confluentis]